MPRKKTIEELRRELAAEKRKSRKLTAELKKATEKIEDLRDEMREQAELDEMAEDERN